MPKSILLVLSNATEGDDAEFNRWYEHQHLPDVLKVTDVVAAQRFALNPSPQDASIFPWKYLAIYEIDNEDVSAFQAELGKRAGTAVMPLSPTLDSTTVKMLFASAIGARQVSEG